ncbi:unnamed protein product [Schistosoma spindalis]|nr:unnamed protein product [Schistosoma spindale]
MKKLAGRCSKPEQPIKINEDKPNTGIKEQQNRWLKHFEKLLNRPGLRTHRISKQQHRPFYSCYFNLQYKRQDSEFHCTGLKLRELLQPSSKTYSCFWTTVYSR